MVSAFRGRALPEPARLVGWAWCMDRYTLELPLPPYLTAIAGRHRPRDLGGWRLMPERYAPSDDLLAHVTFALRYEGVNLAVLEALAHAVAPDSIAAAVRSAPSGAYARRLWFLYEWLTGTRLDLPDAGKVKAVNAVDPTLQVALPHGAISARHRVRDNLPGTRGFCPLVRRTPPIVRAQDAGLAELARAVLGRTHADILARAAAFLLLSDSRASFRIEGETPSPDRARRWGQSIARAGTTRLSIPEFEALQRLVVGDARFVRLGLREEGGFVGEHDRTTGEPLPGHISARAEDLGSLMEGIVAHDARTLEGRMDPVVAAAVIAFGFVYVHPFEDGNGRIHRWLIHHVLAASGFSPAGVVFPVSAVMLRNLDAYRGVLESYSRPLLGCIEWRPTGRGNVEVLNDTARWYRYFDATAHAEYLYSCVETTVREDLPAEFAWLEAYDRFAGEVQRIADMPARTVDLLHRFLRQHSGRLSGRAREREFAALQDDEVARIEAIYAASVAHLSGRSSSDPSTDDEST